jgi:hypothetical protein
MLIKVTSAEAAMCHICVNKTKRKTCKVQSQVVVRR